MKLLRSSSYSKWLAAGTSLFVLAVTGFVVMREWDALVSFPWRLDIRYLILTVVFHSVALGVTFWVWHLMIVRLGDFDDLRLNFRFYYVSTLAKRIPTPVWYVGGRLMMYQSVGVSVSEVLNCVVLENVIIGIAGVFTFLVLLPFYSRLPETNVLPLTLVGAVGILVLLTRPQVFVDVTNWILKRLRRQRLDRVPARKDILLWGGLYILPWLVAGLSLYCVTHSFSGRVGLGIIDAIGVSTLAMLVALLSALLPGGLGLRELTSGVLLAYWMPFSSAIVISFVYRLIQTANEMFWALAATRLSAPVVEQSKEIDP